MPEKFRSASKHRAIHTHTFTAIIRTTVSQINNNKNYGGADKSLARPGRKQATATKL